MKKCCDKQQLFKLLLSTTTTKRKQSSKTTTTTTTTTTIRRCLIALLMSCIIAIYQIYFVVVGSATTIKTTTTTTTRMTSNNNKNNKRSLLLFDYDGQMNDAISPVILLKNDNDNDNDNVNNNNNNNLSFCCLQHQSSSDTTHYQHCSDEKVCWKKRKEGEETTTYTTSTNTTTTTTTTTDTTTDTDTHTGNNNTQKEKDEIKLTVALMYYAEPAMLIKQLDHFMTTYPQELLNKFILLIVDDGSPHPSLSAKIYVESYYDNLYLSSSESSSTNKNKTNNNIISNNNRELDIRIVRIEDNIQWNTPGARNLAFYVTTTETILMIDSDLLIPKETMEQAITWQTTKSSSSRKSTTTTTTTNNNNNHNRLRSPSTTAATTAATTATATGEGDGGRHTDDPVHVKYYIGHQFNRTKPNGEYKTHPSAMLIDVSNFWDVGGFEEDFSGHYGNEDVAFWYRYKDKKQNPYNFYMEHPEALLVQYDESDPCSVEVLPTPNLVESCKDGRSKLPITTKQTNINEAKFRTRQKTKKWSNLYLRFPWTYYDNISFTTPPP